MYIRFSGEEGMDVQMKGSDEMAATRKIKVI